MNKRFLFVIKESYGWFFDTTIISGNFYSSSNPLYLLLFYQKLDAGFGPTTLRRYERKVLLKDVKYKLSVNSGTSFSYVINPVLGEFL